MKILQGIALALWLTAVAADGWAAVPARPAPASTAATVTIPFEPPIGKAIRLREERIVVDARGGVETPVETTTSEEELLFTGRNANGYLLRWTTTSAAVHAAPDRQAMMEAVTAVGIGKPILMQLDANGTPTNVANMAETRALFVAAFDAAMASIETLFATKPPAEREMVRKTLAGAAGTYRNLPDSNLAQLVLDDAQTIFGFGGGQFEPEVARPFMTSITLPLVNQSMDIQGHVALKAASAEELTIGSTIATNPDDVKAATIEFLSKMMAGLDAPQQERLKVAMNQLQNFEVTIELTLTLDAGTGIVKRAVVRKRSGVPGQTRIETKTFTRIE